MLLRTRLATALLATSLIAATTLVSGCFGWIPKFEAATVAPNAITVPSGAPRGAPLLFEGPWVQEGQRWCVRGQDIRILPTKMKLRKADVCLTTNPVSLRGTAEIEMPGAMGGLMPSLTGPARVSLDLATGQALGKVNIAGGAVPLNKGNYYLRIRFDAGQQVSFGSIKVSSPGASGSFLIDPVEGLFYATGAVDGIGKSRLGAVAVGFSPAGRLPFRAKRSLPQIGRFKMGSHALVGGTVQLAQYPVSITGLVAFDADRNRDGRTVFQGGGAGDMGVAANGQVDLSFGAAGISLNVKMGDASVAVLGNGGRNGGLYFSGASNRGLFNGTPLSFIKPAASFDVSGYIRSTKDLGFNATVRGKVFSLAATNVKLAINERGAKVNARVTLPLNMGNVQVAGTVGRRGVTLVGRGNIKLAGVRIAKARVELGTRGIRVSGRASLFGASVAVSGRVATNGKFHLNGRASVNVGWKRGILPLHLSGSIGVGISNRGPTAKLSGKVCFSGACIPLPGVSLDRHARACLDLRPLGRVCTPKLLR